MEERVEATSQPALRQPGQHAFSRVRDLNKRMLYIVGSAMLVMLVAWTVFALRGLPFALLSLVLIGVMGTAHRHLSPKVERWLQGAEGEREVAAVLTQLKADDWQALHDISLGGGNIDHILVGPGGIFTIETKSHRGRIGIDQIDPRMLKQAYAQKKLLERITRLDVQPLLVFSQAYLVGSVPAQRKGVTILPARMLQHYFSRRRPTLETNKANELYTRLVAALPHNPVAP
jgi:Nuclease-related domain